MGGDGPVVNIPSGARRRHVDGGGAPKAPAMAKTSTATFSRLEETSLERTERPAAGMHLAVSGTRVIAPPGHSGR